MGAGAASQVRAWRAVPVAPGQRPPAWQRWRRAVARTLWSSFYSSDRRLRALSFGHLDEPLWQSQWMPLLLCSSEIQGEHQRQAPKNSWVVYYYF